MAVFESVQPSDSKPSSAGKTITIQVDGRVTETTDGTRVAAVLLALDETAFRLTPASGMPRTAYCMMGVCFECLVEIDGQANQQACLVPAREGMRVVRNKQPYGSVER